MRHLILLLIILVPACASKNSELIREAHDTGDWTALNEHLEAQPKIGQAGAPKCGHGQTMWCTASLFETSCACIRGEATERKVRAKMSRIRGRAMRH